MKERDYSLDFIKGFACILMIFIHSVTLVTFEKTPSGPLPLIVINILASLGQLAPILFFGVSGITSVLFQVKKDIRTIIISYTMFGILGLSYIAVWRSNIYYGGVCDIPQMIAIGVIIILLLQKYVKPNKIFYLCSAILVFLIHFFITSKIARFPGADFLFAPAVFPIFPWISMFFFGIFIYNIKKKWNLLIGIPLIILLVLATMFKKIDGLDKFNMSTSFFIISLIFMCLVFYVARTIKFKRPNNPILYFGKNSLLFLYVHLLIIKVLAPLSNNVLLRWVVVLVLTYGLMKLIQFINGFVEKTFYKFATWAFMALIIALVPLFNGNATLAFSIEVLLGIAFAANYSKISTIAIKWFSNNTIKHSPSNLTSK